MPRSHTHDQHFLRSPAIVAELIGHSNIRKNDTVYDLGAGSGVIASVLSRRCRKVVAVEHEPTALAKLRANLDDADTVKILDDDIMNVPLPDEDFKIFSNPPFSLTSPLVRRLCEAAHPPRAIYLIVQRQFARKVVPSDQHFTSALGIQIAPLYAARIRRPLRKTDFTPPPAVDTVLLELRLRDEPLLPLEQMQSYRKWIATMFADAIKYRKLPLERSGIPPQRKASELSPEQWLQLYTSG